MSRREKYFVGSKGLREWCREHHISYNSVYSRMIRYNLTPLQTLQEYNYSFYFTKNDRYVKHKECLTKSHQNKKHIYTIKGMPAKEYCEKHRLNYSLVRNRLYNGFTEEEAICGHRVYLTRKNQLLVLLNGVETPIQKAVDIATHCLGNVTAVKLRMRRENITLQKAFDDYVEYIRNKYRLYCNK